jgi:CHAT domain-containing protein
MTEAEKLEEQRLLGALSRLSNELANENRRPQARKDLITQLGERVATSRRELELFRSKLFVDHPELRIQRGELSPITMEGAASLIPPKGAIIEFAVAADQTIVFLLARDAVGKTSLVARPVKVKETELATQVEAYRSKLAAGDLDFQAASTKLFGRLLGPIADQLARKTQLVVIPDGPLWDLPFQTLTNQSGKYLIENASVSYALSLTTLREMRRPSHNSGSTSASELIAFGNPIVGEETSDRIKRVFMSEKLDPLPEAERLVSGLAKMYGPNRSRILTGAAAREQVAKEEAPKFRIVQFATHGILNNASPMYSHLVLARDEKNPREDGLLEAWEMKDLDLKADIVILSACDTARGKISGGEGVVGMTWAMFIAGAPTTVASQWKVESSSTTEFMLEFHRQMLGKQKIPKAEALRRASLKLMKMPQYRHPSYWGAWVMVGDGS